MALRAKESCKLACKHFIRVGLYVMYVITANVWLPVTIAMIGKFLISMTFAIAYLYTAELFPTKVRNVAVGAASTFARIGSMSAPYIVDLLVRYISSGFQKTCATTFPRFPGRSSCRNSGHYLRHFLHVRRIALVDVAGNIKQEIAGKCRRG